MIVGISGASGAIYGLRLMERLATGKDVEVHLILSKSGEKTLFLETGKLAADARKLAHFWYPLEDIGSRLASGSSAMDAMVVAPCSIHTMSAIAGGITSNLLTRAARRDFEGKAQADSPCEREPLSFRTFAVHDRARGNGGHHSTSGSCLLPSPGDNHGYRRPQRRPGPGSVGRARRLSTAVGGRLQVEESS